MLRLFLAFLILGAAFYLLEKIFPARPDKPLWRKDSRLDLMYWFFTPLVTRTCSKLVAIAAVVGASAPHGLY